MDVLVESDVERHSLYGLADALREILGADRVGILADDTRDQRDRLSRWV